MGFLVGNAQMGFYTFTNRRFDKLETGYVVGFKATAQFVEFQDGCTYAYTVPDNVDRLRARCQAGHALGIPCMLDVDYDGAFVWFAVRDASGNVTKCMAEPTSSFGASHVPEDVFADLSHLYNLWWHPTGPARLTERGDLVQEARKLAQQAHAGQYRRDGKTPYIVHPQAVASRVRMPQEQAVAWLHDVLEDTAVTADDMRVFGIPDMIITAVELLTKRTGQDYVVYLDAVAANPLARKVKIADMLSNLADTPTDKQLVKYAHGLLRLVHQ